MGGLQGVKVSGHSDGEREVVLKWDNVDTRHACYQMATSINYIISAST